MHAICVTCGTQYAETAVPPERCPICQDERQYVGLQGQKWITLQELERSYKTQIREEEENLISFSIEPRFAIGQRALLIRTAAGNVLWDCLSLFDTSAVDEIQSWGGLAAIAISHPHYYTCLVEWSRRFKDVTVYLHADDREWVMRPDKCIEYWSGESLHLPGGLQLLRCGGHFPGATVLHWPEGANGFGALLTADTIQVVPDRRSVSFMYSYPNYLPLNASAVSKIAEAVAPLEFERIYGAFPAMNIREKGKQALERSVDRYVKAIHG